MPTTDTATGPSPTTWPEWPAASFFQHVERLLQLVAVHREREVSGAATNAGVLDDHVDVDIGPSPTGPRIA